MSDDAVVHLEELLGAEILVWKSGMATVCTWGDELDPREPATDDLARTVGVDA